MTESPIYTKERESPVRQAKKTIPKLRLDLLPNYHLKTPPKLPPSQHAQTKSFNIPHLNLTQKHSHTLSGQGKSPNYSSSSRIIFINSEEIEFLTICF